MAAPALRTSTVPSTWVPFGRLAEVLHDRVGPFVTSAWGVDGRSWMPPVNLEETDESYITEVELPGFEREDVTVDAQRRALVVHGEIERREGAGRHRATRAETFDYRVVLPGEIDTQHVDIGWTDGVLWVEARKAEAAEPHHLEDTA